VSEILADVDGRTVHIFHRHRHDARADDRSDALARVFDGIESEQDRPGAFRGSYESHGCFGDDAQLALGAANQTKQVIACRVRRRPADVENLAVEGDEPDAEKVVGRDAVLQAMRAARVHRDVAADRAGKLRGRVGRVEKAFGPNRFGNRQIGHTGFHPGEAIGEVHLQDAVHLGQRDDDRVFLRDRPARERRAGAARNDVDLLVPAEPQHARDFLGRARQRHCERQPSVRR
jgi:hypothetical protein